ncbi:MAG: serine/threonine protein kinase [Acidobacteriota bacterium]|nr:serine/threonine protein kinase [Acidobacteriota bacterium]
MDTTAKTARIGRYLIERQLGRGAMGVVYLASDPVIGRRIALKVLRLDLPGAEESSERLRSRFQREAQSAGILSHPNIVTVYDAIEQTEDGALCIAMEYVEGTNLSDLLRKPEPLAPDLVLDLAAQIADALEYAHGEGVIHRDVKPANVIVTPNGRVKITDFGIAHLIDTALSDDLRFLGTPSYMAPERIEGREIDQRADLFSLGVVLYQLTTRHMPFKGSSVADLTRSIAREPPTPPERFVPEITPELRGILLKSLEKNPDERYQTAGALATDLRAALSRIAALHRTQPVTPAVPPAESAPAPPVAAGAPPPRRWKIPAAAGIALALVVGGIAWWGSRRPGSPVGEPAREPPPRAAHLQLLGQGAARLAAGDTAAAHDLLRSAELVAPDSLRARLGRRLAASRLRRDEAALREIDVDAAVSEGRAALSRGRWGDAQGALERARALDPEHPSVADLESRLWLARQPARPVEPPPAVEVERPPPPEQVAPQVVRVEPEPVSDVAVVQLDFFSLASRGVLTIYEGDRQLFKEAFRFLERRRFLPPKAATGSLTGKLEIPAGDMALRVYLSLPGRATQVVNVAAELRGGANHVLRLRVADDGAFTADLR